jgi:argininosuccinate lyase
VKAIELGVELQDLSMDELRSATPLMEEDVKHTLSLERTLATKSQCGGTAPEVVASTLAEAREEL